MRNAPLTCCLTIAAFACSPMLTSASSFQIMEQSPAKLGLSFAGSASDVNDATTVFYNGAGMVRLDQASIAVGLNAIETSSSFSDRGSNTGGTRGKTEEVGWVPNLYGVKQLNDRWALGFGINAPFGLASSYDKDWTGRYLATDSELEVINLNLSAAYALTDTLSIGLGLNYQDASATLENNVDSSLGVAPNPLTDSTAKVTGEDSDLVADLSLLWQINSQASIGVNWRQGGDFNLDGDTRFGRNSLCAPGAGYPTGTPPAPTTGTLCAANLASLEGPGEAQLELPDTLTLSGSYTLNTQWTLHSDLALTQWSSIGTINVINANNGATVDTLPLEYDDTLRFSVGASYQVNDDWTWRIGAAMDEAPQTDPAYITPRVPDSDRRWLSVGFNYQFDPALSVDAGYMHVFADDADINHTDSVTGNRVTGEFDSSADVVGVQVNWDY